MSFVTDRASIVTEIERAKAAWVEYVLQVDYENNQRFDLSTVTKAYLAVDIIGLDGDQLDLGQDPLVRYSGQIVLAAGAKCGTGTVEQLKLLDHFLPYLQMRNIDAVRTYEARRQRPVERAGFYYLPMIIYYWRDSVAPAVP